MNRWKWKRRWFSRMFGSLISTAAVLALMCDESSAQPRLDPDARRDKETRRETETVTGKVKSLTTAPRGEIDGAELDDGTLIHWPPHLADRFTAAARRGDRVKVVGRMETTPKGDTHFEVATLTNLDTNATAENDGAADPREKRRKGKPPVPRRNAPEQTVQGTVERLTKAPKGEIDGAVLDDGTVLHWPPHLEDRFSDVIAKGDRVKAVGFEETGKRGEERFEVQTLTNLRTNRSAENEDRRPPPPREPRGDRDETIRRSDRIRQLKQEVERLQREIERLEQER